MRWSPIRSPYVKTKNSIGTSPGRISEYPSHKLADDQEDVATASLLEVFIDEAEKRCWFLFEASRRSD